MASTAAGGARSAPSRTPWGAGRVAAVTGGSLLALLAVALLVAGVALVVVHGTQRDDDGFYTSSTERLSTPTAALTAEGAQLGDVGDPGDEWLLDGDHATVRLTVTAAGAEPLFVGIARERDLDAYLRGVAHDEVGSFEGSRATYDRAGGGATATPPGDERIWAAGTAGAGTQVLEWDVEPGDWAAVVMRADGRLGVVADVSAAADVGDLLLWVGIGLLAAALVLGALGAGLIVAGVPGHGAAMTAATATAPPAVAVTAPEAVAPAHPVTVTARLDEPLSRWRWLVKWFLAIPHVVVLAFLWAAFVVLTGVAWVAILATGRYPRALFDFNVGVLRWTWRVGFYATAALGTDRYPPFTLAPADHPADLDVPYPERLSRGRALVKWLLAIPHLAVLAAFFGAWNVTWVSGDLPVTPPGLLGVLVLVAGFWLLATGRYPRDVFALVVGIARWSLRVAAYVAFMRDEYPPFRLDR
jgi:hypothetical protein